MNWVHKLAGVVSPTEHPTVVLVKEGALRLAARVRSNRKDPLEPDYIRQFAEKSDLDNLLQLRNLLLYVLAFSGFFRSSELCEIRTTTNNNNNFISLLI